MTDRVHAFQGLLLDEKDRYINRNYHCSRTYLLSEKLSANECCRNAVNR
jgi:hypothetical protein